MPKGLLLLLSLLWVRISSETEFQIRNGCPFFDINSKINLLQEDTYFNDNEKLEVYIKGFINKESLFSTIHQVIPNDWKEKVQIKDIRYLHPSAVWVPERNLFLVAMRVWVLSRICFIYTTFYDKDWKEVKDEIIIGSTKVPSVLDIPHSWSIENSGPEDGRLFRAFSDQFFIAFNMKKLDLSARPMFIYSYTTKKTQQLFIPEHQGKVVIMEKNWSPLIIDNEHLYFVYNFENFQIINCKTDGNCIRVHGDYKWKPGFLRGGSPFVRFRNSNYYIALSWTHTELPKEGWCYLYRPALTIAYAAAANPDFDLVYTSEPIDFHKRLFIKPAGPKDSLDDINSCHTWLMSNSIAKWDFENDIVDITLTHQDNYPVAVKATGLTKLVKSIIELYEYGKLPQEDHCADKLLYFYYNRDDLAYPGKGMEEGEFEKKIKPNCQKGEYVEPASDSCQSKKYLECHKLCAECEVYDYCKSCADPNSSPVSGYCICNDGYYSKGDICKKCSNGCAKCSARNNCLACKNPNTVIDNGICKCVEGFVEVYDQASSEFVCKSNSYVAYDPNQKFGCYRGRSEIELSEYQNVMKMTFGYQETGQRLGVFLSTQKELPSIEENKFCEFDITKNKVETLKTSWIEDGFEIEVDIKITKLK